MGSNAKKIDLEDILESYHKGLKVLSKKHKEVEQSSLKKIKNSSQELKKVELKLKKNRLKHKKESTKQKDSLSQTRSILEELISKCQNYELTQAKLEKTITQYSNSLFNIKNSYQETKRLADEAKSHFETYSQELSKARTKKAQITQQVSHYTKKSKKLNERLAHKNRTQQKRFNFLQKRVRDIEILNRDLSHKNHNLGNAYKETQRRIDENQEFEKQYSREIRHLSLDVEQKRIRYENLTELVAKLQRDYDNFCRLYQAKQQELSVSSKKKLAIFHESSRRVHLLKCSESKSLSRLNQFKRDCENLEVEIISYKRTISSLKDLSQGLEEQTTKAKSQLQEHLLKKNQLIKECASLVTGMNSQKKQFLKIQSKTKLSIKKLRLESHQFNEDMKFTLKTSEKLKSQIVEDSQYSENIQRETIQRVAELNSLDLIYQDRVVRNTDLEKEYKTKLAEFSIFENNQYENLKKDISFKQSEAKKESESIINNSKRDADLIIVNARSQATSYFKEMKHEAELIKQRVIKEGKADSQKQIKLATHDIEKWKARLQDQIKTIISSNQELSIESIKQLHIEIDQFDNESSQNKESYFFSNSRKVHNFWLTCSVATVLFLAVLGTKLFLPTVFNSAKRGIASVVLDQNGEVFDEAIKIAQAKRKMKYFTFDKSNLLQASRWKNTVSNKIFVDTWLNNQDFEDHFIRELADFFSYVLKVDDMNSVEVIKLEKSHIRNIQRLTEMILVEDKDKLIESLNKAEADFNMQLTELLGDGFAFKNYLKFRRRFYLDFNS